MSICSDAMSYQVLDKPVRYPRGGGGRGVSEEEEEFIWNPKCLRQFQDEEVIDKTEVNR